MIEAKALRPDDLVFLGNSLYGLGETTSDGDVVLVHECPDGRILQRVMDPWDELETAGERLAYLRGEIDELREQASRQYGNPTRKEIARMQVVRMQEQIDELESLQVQAEVILGRTERCPACQGSGSEGSDICARCWGSGT